MATPTQVLKLWRDGEISTRCALYQFLGDHLFGCSIPQYLKYWGFIALLFVADNCGPWFLRKRLVNRILRKEVYHDFVTSDQVIAGLFPESAMCFKW